MSTEYESDPGWQFLRRTREQITEDQSAPYDSKKDCWIPDKEEGYVAAQILSVKGDQVIVTAKGTEMTIKADLISEMNPPKFEKTEDMSNLTFLNDASVLHNLRARYSAMLIYTYSGLFCVVVNPYKRLPIYTDSVAHMFMGKRKSEMPPHLFAVSDEAYRSMLQNHENQSMLITGESGAGKTENTKKVISYFAFVGASQQAESANAAKNVDGKKKVTLEDQIVQTNPVLEAFGNARTVRNNNSSRFGKFIRIHFSKHGRVASCDIEHYLLEKSRVIRQAPGERCYHIFYQMTSDYKAELKPLLLLDRPMKDYWFVAQAELTVDGMDDAEEFKLTDEAFDILHFTAEEKLNCYKLMSAHMHIGNMKFKQRPREEQAEPDETDEAEKAAEMYGVAADELLKAFTHPRVKVGTEWVNKGQNVDQVNWAVGAMGKAIYGRVFNWLVKKCNITLDQKGVARDYFIGVLDIAGFEIFDFNSFEQLWINFVNEKLQQFFNHHMFVLEQEEYTREGINWTFIDFGLDLEACIELIEKPMGIIAMLDEECIVPKATDMTLAQKLNEQHLGKHPNFEKPKPPKGKQAEAHFAMRHYAGLVRYNVTNWLEKNKDPLNDTVAACLKASKGNALLNEIWADYVTQEEASHASKSGGQKKKGKSGSFMTVSMLYRESLNNLMTMLYKTHPHFIRCIIPNEKKKSGLLDAALVLNQLTCNGVLEGIRICRKGFPNRTFHPDFVHRYAILGADEAKSSDDPKECAVKMLNRLTDEGSMKAEMFKVGLTKVFFKAGVLAHLEDLRDIRLTYLIAGFQAQIRYCYAQIDLKERQKRFDASIIIQRNVANWACLMNWSWFKLFIDTMPIVRESKKEQILENLRVNISDSEKKLHIYQTQRLDLEEQLKIINAENEAIIKEIKHSKNDNNEVMEQMENFVKQQTTLENQLGDINEKLKAEEQRTADEVEATNKLHEEIQTIKKTIEDVEHGKRKKNAERITSENQIRSLNSEVWQQQQAIAKLNKERQQQDDLMNKLNSQLATIGQHNTQINTTKIKLDDAVHELEQLLEMEKCSVADINRSKRKIDGELKIAQETVDELRRENEDILNAIRKRESSLRNLKNDLDDQCVLTQRTCKEAKNIQLRMQEIEEEIEAIREARTIADRLFNEQQSEYDEMRTRLDEEIRAATLQIECGKQLELESAKLRRELQQSNLDNTSALDLMRKKDNDAISEFKEKIATTQREYTKYESQNAQLRLQIANANSQLQVAQNATEEFRRITKSLGAKTPELQTKDTNQLQEIEDFESMKRNITAANNQLKLRQKELHEQINALSNTKAQLVEQLKDANRIRLEESGEKQRTGSDVRGLQNETIHLRGVLEDEIRSTKELRWKLAIAENDLQQWRDKFADKTLLPNDIIEGVKRKQISSIRELEEALDLANSKVADMEKTKMKLKIEAEEANKQSEHHIALIAQLEKKTKDFNVAIDDRKRKVDEASRELEREQQHSHDISTQLYSEEATNDKLLSEVQSLQYENNTLRDEIKELQRQLADGVKTIDETRKLMRRVESDKEKLQQALDETEVALEIQENEHERAQNENAKIRSEVERSITEKDDQLQNTKAAQQRAIESIQMMLEDTKRESDELRKTKIKLEADISEMQIALTHANEANEDARNNITKYDKQISELQQTLDDECANREHWRQQCIICEKKLINAKNDKDELVEREIQIADSRKQFGNEIREVNEHIEQLSTNVTEMSLLKKKLDAELVILNAQLDDALNEMKITEDRSKKVEIDAAHLSDALNTEQKQNELIEKEKRILEMNIKELQAKIDQAETTVLRSGKNTTTKLEQRFNAINTEIDREKCRHQAVLKNIAKLERKSRQLEFEVDENKKRMEQMQQMTETLQAKSKEQKRIVVEAEEAAAVNLQKFKRIQAELERAEDRAENAENSLLKASSNKPNETFDESSHET